MNSPRQNFIFATPLSFRFLFIVVVTALCVIYSAWIATAGQAGSVDVSNVSIVSKPVDASGNSSEVGTDDFRSINSPSQITTAAVLTWKGSQDNRWSNPGNWDAGRVPGTSDVARFAASSSSEVLVNADSSGTVSGLILEK